MALRDKFDRPLRIAIRQKASDGDPDARKMKRLLLHPGQMARLCAQTEVLAAQYGESGNLDAGEFGDIDSPGFRQIIAFIMAHWSEIMQLALVILPMVVGDDGTDASEE